MTDLTANFIRRHQLRTEQPREVSVNDPIELLKDCLPFLEHPLVTPPARTALLARIEKAIALIEAEQELATNMEGERNGTLEELRAWQKNAGELEDALNTADLFSNPHSLEKAAEEIDCCRHGCEHTWHEFDTNAAGCHKSEAGEYCPNDIAEMLRAVAKIGRVRLPSSAA